MPTLATMGEHPLRQHPSIPRLRGTNLPQMNTYYAPTQTFAQSPTYPPREDSRLKLHSSQRSIRQEPSNSRMVDYTESTLGEEVIIAPTPLYEMGAHALDPGQQIRRHQAAASIGSSPSRKMSIHSLSSQGTYETSATSTLPGLQTKGMIEENDQLEPLAEEDDPRSFDLVAPLASDAAYQYSLETRSEQLFSREHLEVIFAEPSLLQKFTAFLSNHRPQSVPVLIYYLDAKKALKAISYANAIAEALEPLKGHDFTGISCASTVNAGLEEKADRAFDVLVQEDLPAYVTHVFLQVVSVSITKRVTGTLAPHLRDASEGLAEVFCLTDPSRPDNPIVFASEEFHRTTQYGMSYVIGRNCRFLQGPRTNPFSVNRLRNAIQSGKEVCETFLNYRRDGSPFLNLLMTAPLSDSKGNIRYFIGAQVDVSGLAKECTDLESLQMLVEQEERRLQGIQDEDENDKKDEFQKLCEMFNTAELDTVRRWGGSLHREQYDDDAESKTSTWHRPRLLLKETTEVAKSYENNGYPSPGLAGPSRSGKLIGVYEHYLLVRPYPSLRILFASPSLRVPGILQSLFMNKIGGSSRVRDELTQALAEGRGVTAKVRWVSKADEEGRNRWIHCTPLIGSNGQIGVWMIVIVDDEKEGGQRKWRQAPPVQPMGSRHVRRPRSPGAGSTRSNRPYTAEGQPYNRHLHGVRGQVEDRPGSAASGASSPYSVAL